MNTTDWLFLAGAMTVAGQWSRGQTLSPKTVIAVALLALMITVLQDIDSDIAQAFTILIVVAVALSNLPSILDKLNNSLAEKQPASLF